MVLMEVGHALAWPFPISDIRERRVAYGISRENSRNPRIPRLLRSKPCRPTHERAPSPLHRRDEAPRPGIVVFVPVLSIGSTRSVDNPYRVPVRFRRETGTGPISDRRVQGHRDLPGSEGLVVAGPAGDAGRSA